MILTDITATKQGNMALFVDGKFVFSVLPELLYTYGLSVGVSLDEAFLETLRSVSLENKAKQAALTFLSHKEYTSAELEARLSKKVGEDAASAAVARMEELGLVNDESYAERYARTLSRKGYGERRIAMEMRRKGLSPEHIEVSVEQLEVDPAEQAAAFLQKKYPLWNEDPSVKRRAFGALTRRGFRYEDIRRAMGILEFEE